jgi:hypothetical protein
MITGWMNERGTNGDEMNGDEMNGDEMNGDVGDVNPSGASGRRRLVVCDVSSTGVVA